MSKKKGLVKNVASLGLVQIANYVFPLITVPIISRIIGPDKFGIINYAASFVGYFVLIIGYGFDLTATRKIAREPHNKKLRDRVFSEVLYSQILLFCFSLIVFSVFLNFIPILRVEKLVTYFTFLICISTVLTQNWLFQAMQDLSKIAWLNFISKLLFTFTILFFIDEKEDYLWQPLLTSLIQIIISSISFTWAYKRYKLSLIKIKLTEVLSLLKNESTVFFSMVVISLYTTTNTIILGVMQDSIQVGYFSAGQKLIDIIRSIVSLPLSVALYPFIGNAFSESINKGLAVVHKILPIIIILTGLVGVFILISGPITLRFFYGDKFEPAIPVFQILSFIPMIISISNVFGIQIMMNLKMDKLFFKITISGAILSVILNLVLVTKLGYIGTAINWLVTEIFITLSLFYALKRQQIHPITLESFKMMSLRQLLIYAKSLKKT